MAIVNILSGYKTYIAALGLFGLAAYQLSVGQYDQAAQSFFAGLAAVGLRGAIANVTPATPAVPVTPTAPTTPVVNH